jgi:methyltransferase (TIGR00027 family)
MKAGRTSLTAEGVALIRTVFAASPDGTYAQDPVGPAILMRPLRRPARLARAMVARAPRLLRLFSRLGTGLPEGVALRTLRLDELVRVVVEEGGTQIVLLGAGLDLRAFRLDELAAPAITVFEVDHPDTQRVKRRRLGDRLPQAHELHFVAVDFESQSLEKELLAAGFSSSKPSVVIWEGVTMYLRPEARRSTISALGRLLAPGSRVGISYVRPEMLAGPLRSIQSSPLALLGEPLLGAVSSRTLENELEEAGFEVHEDDDAHGWAARYTGTKGPREWERIVVAMRRSLYLVCRI